MFKIVKNSFLPFFFFLLVVALAYPAFSQSIAVDPTAYTPSARILGLGRAFVGLADDAAAIYLNPAGLSKADVWSATSMSGSFLEDYNYLSASGLYPTNFGVFGIGYDSYSIGGAPSTTIDATSRPDDPIPIIDTSVPSISNYNSVLVLSYATKIDRVLPKIPIAKNIGIGANYKIYSTGLSGDHITQGTASGQEMDLGVIMQATPWISLGASAQNLLTSAMGGKLTYANGHYETYPASLKLGSAFTVIDQDSGLLRFGQNKLTALIDADYWPTLTGWPTVFHLGLEWTPISIVTLRAGIDQSAMGDGLGGIAVNSDPAFGVGFFYNGFKFDYGYHQFTAVPGVDNHSFSFSYSPDLKKSVITTGKMINVDMPQDKSMSFSSEVNVKGKVADVSRVKMLQINDQPVTLSPKGDFFVVSPLTQTKNKIRLKALDRFKLTLASQEVRVLKLSTFPDVPEGYWARQQISLISMLGIVTGYPDGSFKPEGEITRAEMAALLMRAGTPGGAAKEPVKFADVKNTHWAAQYIADATSYGVVEGYPDKTFKPKGNITRAEGLAMIARFAGITPEAYDYSYFSDIVSSYWAAPIIAGASRFGLLEYLKGKPFEPKKNLMRAEAVEILSKTQFVKNALNKDLLKWESY